MTEQTDPLASGRNDATLLAVVAAAAVGPADEGLEIPVVFQRQPRPLEARHRVAYRTALLVPVLSRFRGSAASVENVHLFMWATRSARTRQLLQAWWAGRRFAGTITQRLDPDLQVTLNLAAADGLVLQPHSVITVGVSCGRETATA